MSDRHKNREDSRETKYIAIRHGCDDEDHTIYKHEHDTPLCSIEEHKSGPIDHLVHNLLDKNFIPDLILSSPFVRCQETSQLIQAKLADLLRKDIPVQVDVRLSRYFFSREKSSPDVHTKTANYNVPIQESRREFTRRVHTHLRRIRKKHPGKIVWSVTHGMVCYEIARLLSDSPKKSTQFLETFPIVLGR